MSFAAPLSSLAVTVIVASPRDTPVSVSVLSYSDTVATPEASEPADTVCLSPGSASLTITVRASVEPREIVRSENGPTSGWLLVSSTSTSNCTAADVSFDSPLLSLAVTVIVAEPRDTPRTVNVLPFTETVTAASSELADTVCVSPASPSVTVTVLAPVDPRDTVKSEMEPTTGRLFGTVTSNSPDPDAPHSSVAVTVIVAVPRETPRTVNLLPDTDTVATPVSLELADTAGVSPLSPSVTLTVRVPVDPRDTVKSEIEPTDGRLFGTVTRNSFAADVAFDSPLLSVAVTVIVAAPHDRPRTVNLLPFTETVATPVALEFADTVWVSPESPSVTAAVSVSVDPRGTVRSGIEPTTGRVFGTVTSNSTAADVAFDSPLLSVAATVIVAVPRDTPRTVNVLPLTETVATPSSLELAETVCVSPVSPSVTLAVRLPVDPRDTVKSEMELTTGRLFGTVTSNSTAADVSFDSPLLSVAVTVIVAVPRDTPLSLNVLPDTDTVTAASSELADTVCVSPASPSVTVAVLVPAEPRDTVKSEMEPTTGRLFDMFGAYVTVRLPDQLLQRLLHPFTRYV